MKSGIFSLFIAVFALSGCAELAGNYKRPDVETYDESGKIQTVTNSQSFEAGIIKSFPDIPIPSSHRIDLEKTVIFTSPTQTMGKIALAGRGDADSLFRFFETQMVNNGWSLVNSFQSSTSSMYFAKPGRFVAIIIEARGKNSAVYLNIGPE